METIFETSGLDLGQTIKTDAFGEITILRFCTNIGIYGAMVEREEDGLEFFLPLSSLIQ